MKAKTLLVFLITLSNYLYAQHKNDTISDWDRTFMPALQMGYVGHGTSQLSGGLMIQTSIEYRHKSNVVFRINYDDFNSEMNIEYPLAGITYKTLCLCEFITRHTISTNL